MGKYDLSETKKEIAEFTPVKEEKTVEEQVDQRIAEVQDKIKTIEEMKVKPVKPGYATIDIPPGKYAVDLNDLFNGQISECPGTVIPMLIDHAVRTNLDKRDSYKVEKRIIDFKYWWVFGLIAGIIVMAWIATMMFG